MKILGLISGGKDSIFNLLECVKRGHEIVCLGHLKRPEDRGEMDSYMYQTVGSEMAEAIAQAMELPLLLEVITKKPINLDMNYVPNDLDEVENLFTLVEKAKAAFPSLEGVASGAILSSYQKIRVENVCERLGLKSVAYLWNRDQKELLSEMIENKMDSILIKVCSMGFDKVDLMQSISQMKDKLLMLGEKFFVNVCGEGGEYESLTLDCPLYKRRINILEYDVVMHSADPFCPVYYATIKKWELADK